MKLENFLQKFIYFLGYMEADFSLGDKLKFFQLLH